MATYGGKGNTLVKGVVMELPAEAFSVKSGNEVKNRVFGGDLVTYGAQVTTHALEGAKWNNFS